MDLFNSKLYNWFNKNKRELPWRKNRNPYLIWISEIILQQTRVAQGTEYYNRFVQAFPTITDLAAASEDEVLKLWQGLGYYSRARNLHFTAKYIVKNHDGVFPDDYKTILSLKGVGEYTAAAIASIAFEKPVAAVDGNVTRVLSRYFGVEIPIDTTKGKNEIAILAKQLLPMKNFGDHNQAVMEFGALQCVPKSPVCANCPLADSCFAFQNKIVDTLPVKSKKTPQRIRYFYFYYIDSGTKTVLEKRTGNDIWKNLYQFPIMETSQPLSDEDLLTSEIGFLQGTPYNIKSVSGIKKHVLSHQVIYARLIHVEIDKFKNTGREFIPANKKDIYKFAVSRLMEDFIVEFGLIEK